MGAQAHSDTDVNKKKRENNIEDIYIEQVKVTFRQNTGPVCQPRTMPQKHSVFCLRELHKEFEVTLYLNGLSTIVEKERMEQWVVSERLTMTRALNSHLFEPFIFTFSWSSKYLNNVDSIMCFITSVTYVFFNLRNGRNILVQFKMMCPNWRFIFQVKWRILTNWYSQS